MILELTTSWSSAHFYSQPLWTPEKNTAVFGKCYSPQGHGHDYKLEACFKLENSKDLAASRPQLKAALESLKERLDHHHLNFMIPEFKTQIPTTENLALYCWNHLPESLLSLKLYERPDLWVEIKK